MNEWIKEWTEKQKKEQMNEEIKKWQENEWINKGMNKKAKEWADG